VIKALESYEVDIDSPEVISMYEDTLGEIYGEIDICGMKYDVARALKEVDPTAYRCGLSDYADSLDKEQFQDFQDLQEAVDEAQSTVDELEDEEVRS
jgi:hypothetical protein